MRSADRVNSLHVAKTSRGTFVEYMSTTSSAVTTPTAGSSARSHRAAAWSRCVLPVPVGPTRTTGAATTGGFATICRAVVHAARLQSPTTKDSNDEASPTCVCTSLLLGEHKFDSAV